MKTSPLMKNNKKKRKSNSKLEQIIQRSLTDYNQILNALPRVRKLRSCSANSLNDAVWRSNYKFKITRAVKKNILAIQRTIITNKVQLQNTNQISINDRIGRKTSVVLGENFKLECSASFLQERVFKMANNLENTTNSNCPFRNVTITFEQMLSIRKKRLNKKYSNSVDQNDLAISKNDDNDCVEVIDIDDENPDVIEIKDDGDAVVIECIYNNIANSAEVKSVQGEETKNYQDNEDKVEAKDDLNVVNTKNDLEENEDNNTDQSGIMKQLDETSLISIEKNEKILHDIGNLTEKMNNCTGLLSHTINDSLITIPELPSKETPKVFIDDISNQSVIMVTPYENDVPNCISTITITDTSNVCQDLNDSDIIFVDERSSSLRQETKRKPSLVIIDDDEPKPITRSPKIISTMRKTRKRRKRKRWDFSIIKKLPNSTITNALLNGEDVNSNYRSNRNGTVTTQSCSSHNVTSLNPLPLTTENLALLQNNQNQSSILPNYHNDNVFGSNIHNTGHIVREGLRQIVIDGSNIAIGHSNNTVFSVKGLQIAIDYFIKKGHKVKAFVPQYRLKYGQCTDSAALRKLIEKQLVVLTPSREVKGRRITPYDDRFIIQYATTCEGIVVSNDNYRDLLREKPEWRYTIEKRLLMYTWVDDVLIFPEDPLGRHGPNLSRFLRFP